MIPRTIHYFWIGDSPKPKTVLYCIESWKKFCPDYRIIEWNETNYDFSKNEYLRQAYKKKQWAYCTDYARLDVVYKYGGVYLDTDVELIKPLDSLLNYRAFFGFERSTEKQHFIATGLGFGAEEKMPLLISLMEDYNSSEYFNQDGTVKFCPCPQMNTKSLLKLGLSQEDRDQMIEGVMFFAADVLCPKMYCSSEMHLTERTVSIHHYDATWLDGDRKKLHDRNVRLNEFLGDSLGNKTAKAMEDTEYLYKSLGKRIKRVFKRG